MKRHSLVWGCVALAFCLGVFLRVTSPPIEDVLVTAESQDAQRVVAFVAREARESHPSTEDMPTQSPPLRDGWTWGRSTEAPWLVPWRRGDTGEALMVASRRGPGGTPDAESQAYQLWLTALTAQLPAVSPQSLQSVDHIAGGLRPVAATIGAAWETIRRSLPMVDRDDRPVVKPQAGLSSGILIS